MSRNTSVSLGRRAFALASEDPPIWMFSVSVEDVNGKPWSGVNIELIDGSTTIAGETDSNGVVKIGYSGISGLPKQLTFRAIAPNGDSQAIFVDSVVALNSVTQFRLTSVQPIPLVTTAEGVAFVLGVLAAAIGFYKDHVVGNVVGGLGSSVAASAVFSAVKRHL